VEAKIALTSLETPVGCVFVLDNEGQVILGRGHNKTNESKNVKKLS